MSEGTEAALLRVVSGDPTAEELAAVVIVLTASSPGQRSQPARPPSGWSAYWRSLRAPLQPGPDAWRSSAQNF